MDWCGIVAVDKPTGYTSRQIVDRVAKIVRPAKTGHAGTLDPLATGVLVIAIGSATRLISYIQQGRKHYVGQFRLGVRSNTDDIEGEIVAGGETGHVTREILDQVVARFAGVISQTPPQFSAVHVGGKRAYAMARKGEQVEIAPRPVEVHSIRVPQFEGTEFELDIECGSGTYVRSIGRDIGEELGCGAIMTSLRRLKVGAFDLNTAISFDQLDRDRLQAAIRPPLDAVAHLPSRTVSPDEIVALWQGRAIGIGQCAAADGDEVTLVSDNHTLIGLARLEAVARRLQPSIMLSR